MSRFQYNSIVQSITSTATAGGTTTLSSTSSQIQNFTGSSNQTVKLPPTTGMSTGQWFEIYNSSTGSLTIQYQDATSFLPAPTVSAGTSLIVKLTSTGTTNGTWIIQASTSGGISSWQSGFSYAVNNIVLYEKNIYVCVTANTSGSSFEGDVLAGYWTLVNTPQFGRNTMLVGNNFEDNDVGGWNLAQAPTLVNGFPSFNLPAVTTYGAGFYSFTVTAANATAGAVYTNNANNFTVYTTISGATTLLCSGGTTNAGFPTASGTLTKVSGTGDATITFSAYITTTNSFSNFNAPSVTATGPISGKYSLNFAASNTYTAGPMYITQPNGIDAIDRGKVLQIKFAYEVVSGAALNFSGTSANTMGVGIYDITNGSWIQPAGVFNFTQSSGVGICTATFQTPINMIQYQLAVFTPAAGAQMSILLDDFYVGPQPFSQGPAMSDWQTYTPTITGQTTNPTKGTTLTDLALWRRVGSDVEIRYDYRQNSAGTAGSGTYFISLPSGLVADSSRISPASVNGGTGRGVVGNFSSTGGGANPILLGNAVLDSTFTKLGFYWVSDTTATNTWSSGDSSDFSNANMEFSFTAKIPIVGWSSNTVQSADTDTRVVAARYTASGANSLANGTIQNFNNQIYDTHGAVTTGASWKFTAPISGYYTVSASFDTTTASNTAGTFIGLQLYKNGSAQQFAALMYVQTTSTISYTGHGTAEILLNAGDFIDLRSSNNLTAVPSASGTTTLNYIEISRKAGPAVIQATSIVAARMNGATATITSTYSDVAWTTVTNDTNGAFSTPNYTTPIVGYYDFSGQLNISATTIAAGQLVTIGLFNTTTSTTIEETTYVYQGTNTTACAIPFKFESIQANGGTQFKIQVKATTTSPVISASSTLNFFSVKRAGGV